MKSTRVVNACMAATLLAFWGPPSALAGPPPSPGTPVACNVNDDMTQDLAFSGATTNRVNLILNGASSSQGFFPNGGGTWELMACQKVGSAGLISQGSAGLISQGMLGVAANFVRIQTLNAAGNAVVSTTFVGRGGGAWSFVGTADVDGDGLQDLLFDGVNGTPGAPFGRITFVVGPNARTNTFINLAGGFWGFIGKGDADADGDEDVFYISSNANFLRIDISNGTSIPTSRFLSLAGGIFTVKAIGDMTGDDKADLLLDSSSGAKIQQLDGGTALGSIFRPNGGGTLVPTFIADTDGNRGGDVIFVGATQSRIDILNNAGLGFVRSGFVQNQGFTPVMTGDFDGDGNEDIVGESAGGIQFTLLSGSTAKRKPAAIPNGGGTLALVP